MNSKPIIMFGAGGHASVLADILLEQKREIIAVVSPEPILTKKVFSGIEHLKNDEEIKKFNRNKILVVNGIGMLPRTKNKKNVNDFIIKQGYKFQTVISEHSYVSKYAKISDGAQILPSSTVQTGAIIGAHTIINTGVVVEHDCVIGSYNHIAPNATLCGGVKTFDEVFVGSNATVIQNVTLYESVIIGAGAVVRSDIKEGTTIYAPR